MRRIDLSLLCWPESMDRLRLVIPAEGGQIVVMWMLIAVQCVEGGQVLCVC